MRFLALSTIEIPSQKYYTIPMIGIFGGAFDPPHKEHIGIAESIAKEFDLEKVVFLPSGNSPHKNLETPFAIRMQMLSAALEGHSFEIDPFEDAFDGPAYSYRVLPFLKEKYGDIAFIIGGDSLLALDRWREPQEILKICHLIVIPRGTDTLAELRKAAAEHMRTKGGKIVIAEHTKGDNVSSSVARAKIALNMQTPEILPSVQEIIKQHGLYQDYSDMIERVKGALTTERWHHTCGVVVSGLKINERIGLPREKVFVACLLHDCMKQSDRIHPGVPADAIGTKVLHAFNGAEEARIAFGIEDNEILDAIRYHTTGRAGMTVLDKLVYTADMVDEETRDFEGVEHLREVSYRDLDRGFMLCFKVCYDRLLATGKPIYPLSTECFNEYCKGV